METTQGGGNDEVVIDLRNLSKVYGTGHLAVKAVDNVSLHIVKGEVVVIMGPSGSGKTTLLQLIGALLKPTSGEIIVAGRGIAVLPQKELSRIRLKTFGFIFQTPNLLSALTAIQNVELVIELAGVHGKNAKRRAREMLEQLGLGSRLSHRPATLSGGEQQRVAIARALANDPSILLADEPTANLDSEAGHSIMELMKGIAKEGGKTIVIVSHDLRIRYFADRVLWLEDGHLGVRWSENATVDPVCLMVVEKERTPHMMEHEGKKYYFCSTECKREFEMDPAKYQKVEA